MVAEVALVRETFNLTRGQLAKAMEVSANTVSRWERGTPPTGLHRSVLTALHTTAVEVRHDRAKANLIRGVVLVGVAGLLAYALTRR